MPPGRATLITILASLLLVGCSQPASNPFDPTPHDPAVVQAAIDRCDLTSEDATALRNGSLELLDSLEQSGPSSYGRDVLVGYRRDATPAMRIASLQTTHAHPALASMRATGGGTFEVAVAPGQDPIAVARDLLEDPNVAFAHPDVRLETASIPNDPYWSEQWNLQSFGAVEAWRIERGSSDVTIAVIDAGIDEDHPDFRGRLLLGWDFYDDDDNPGSNAPHGSHVAGIAAANGFDGIGVTGLAPRNVRILPIKVFDDAGGNTKTASASANDVADALRWAAGLEVPGVVTRSMPADVATLSLAFTGAYTSIPVLDRAIRDARAAGMLALAASGNRTGTTPADRGILAPANAPCAIAVGSIDADLERSTFSHYAATGRTVDLAAPGGQGPSGGTVLSTIGDADWGYEQGTSMAVPFVAGVAALMLSADPTLETETLIAELLSGSARPLGGSPSELGFGVPCPDALLGAATQCGYP